MPENRRRPRALVTFPDLDQLKKEARKQGLALAAYVRRLVATHPERKNRVPRAG